jgi:hypothetical protein
MGKDEAIATGRMITEIDLSIFASPSAEFKSSHIGDVPWKKTKRGSSRIVYCAYRIART